MVRSQRRPDRPDEVRGQREREDPWFNEERTWKAETHQVANPKPSQSSWSFSLVGLDPWLLSVSLNWAGAEWSWALGRKRQVKRPRSWRTGVTLRQVALQPTQSCQHNRSERRKSGRGRHVPAPKGQGRRATDRSRREGSQTRRLEGTGLDLRGHQLCGVRKISPTQRLDALATNPVQPTQPTFLTQFSSEDKRR